MVCIGLEREAKAEHEFIIFTVIGGEIICFCIISKRSFMEWNIVVHISPRYMYNILESVMHDDGALHCPSSSKAG